MQDRLETADILPVLKAAAIENLLRSNTDDVLFVVGTMITAFGGALLFRRALLGDSLTFGKLTLPSFFVITYALLMSIPAVLWFYVSPGEPIRHTYFLAIQSVLLTFPVGVLLANALALKPQTPSRIVQEFCDGPILPSEEDQYVVPLFVAMMLASLLTAGYYVLTSPYVPLIGAFTAYGDLPGSEVRRRVALDGVFIHFAHALVARFLLPFCLVYSYFMADLYKGRWRLTFAATLVATALISLMTFDRTYPFSVVIFIALAIYFKHQHAEQSRLRLASARVRRSGINFWTFVYVMAMIAFSMFVGGVISTTQYNFPITVEALWDATAGFLINRVFLDASYMAYIYFEEFSSPDTFLYGTSLHVLVSALFGIEFIPTISPSFVAELWINFGWFGVVIGSTLVGFVLQQIQLTLFDRKSVPAMSFFVIMLLNGAWIIYGHLFASMVISVFVPSVVVLTWLRNRRSRVLVAPGLPHGNQVLRVSRSRQ